MCIFLILQIVFKVANGVNIYREWLINSISYKYFSNKGGRSDIGVA